MSRSALSFHCRLNTAEFVAAGSRANTLRQKGDAVFPVFSSRAVGNSHSVLIEHDGVRHAVRNMKHRATVAVDVCRSGEIVSARITETDAKRLIANAFQEAA